MSELVRVISPPEKQDFGWLLEVLSLAYADTDVVWGEDTVAQKIAEERGKMGVDRFNRVYGALSVVNPSHGIFVSDEIPGGVIPAGISTQVKDLVPQHHLQSWIDKEISAVLADLCRDIAGDRPVALDFPLWAFVAADLAVPFWRDSIVRAEVVISRSGSRALAYVPTLRLAIQRLEAAGL